MVEPPESKLQNPHTAGCSVSTYGPGYGVSLAAWALQILSDGSTDDPVGFLTSLCRQVRLLGLAHLANSFARDGDYRAK
jgi:hypothetical protein